MQNPLTIALLVSFAGGLAAQSQPTDPQAVVRPVEEEASAKPDFETAAKRVSLDLEASVAELNELRERLAAEKVPLSRRLRELEAELSQARLDYQKTTRLLDRRTLDLSNLKNEIRARQDEVTYVANLLGDYGREFEASLHIAEMQRYEEVVETARLAPENGNLTAADVNAAQLALVDASLSRLDEALAGARFEGSAVDPTGLVRHGTFLVLGPAAFFRADGAEVAGTVEQRLGSLEPSEISFADPEDARLAALAVTTGSGLLPLDPTLGNAHKIEATQESFLEHVKKGGPVMVPIFAMAAAALLVAIYKWLALVFLRRPSRRRVAELFDAVDRGDLEGAQGAAADMHGPLGKMLAAGVAHLREPRELIEEVMYETVLTTRIKLQGFLPFIAICAASAPLLGLLGTVTGIINTFKIITVFGSGDVKSLSGGISEALITTKFGLIVAIPSLLLHAFLARRTKAVIDDMEKSAMALANHAGSAAALGALETSDAAAAASLDEERIRGHVTEILSELVSPLVESRVAKGVTRPAQPDSVPERQPTRAGRR